MVMDIRWMSRPRGVIRIYSDTVVDIEEGVATPTLLVQADGKAQIHGFTQEEFIAICKGCGQN